MRQILAAAVLVGAAGAGGAAHAEPPWIDAAARATAASAVEAAAPGRPTSEPTATLQAKAVDEPVAESAEASDAAVERAILAARAALVASLAGGGAADAPPVAEPAALSIPVAFIAAYVASTVAQAEPAAAATPPEPVFAVLPLPPQKPWPGLEPPTATVLPYTGGLLRAMPELPPLVPRGRLASFDDDRPYAHFNAQLDCITDHQRFDRQSARQKFPHACGPTRDIDTALPGFTTR
jgi:hypothetical protein